MGLSITDPIAFLLGGWSFKRRVEDRLTGIAGHASGKASFESTDDVLRWIEHGTLEMGGQEFEASRELSIVPEDGGWMVRFDDGRPFHRLDLVDGRTAVEHRCRADLYSGDLALGVMSTQQGFTTRWKVAGPAKDQTIETVYRRDEDWESQF